MMMRQPLLISMLSRTKHEVSLAFNEEISERFNCDFLQRFETPKGKGTFIGVMKVSELEQRQAFICLDDEAPLVCCWPDGEDIFQASDKFKKISDFNYPEKLQSWLYEKLPPEIYFTFVYEKKLIQILNEQDIESLQKMFSAPGDGYQQHLRDAFLYSASRGLSESLKFLLRANLIDINVKGEFNGDTALILAAKNGHREIVSLLLQKGAKLEIVNNENKKAIEIAKENNHWDLIPIFYEYDKNSIRYRMRDFEDDIPELFECLITYNWMEDPLTVSTGITYERYILEKMFSEKVNSNTIKCPTTNREIHRYELGNQSTFAIKKEAEKFVEKWQAKQKQNKEAQQQKFKLESSTPHPAKMFSPGLLPDKGKANEKELASSLPLNF